MNLPARGQRILAAALAALALLASGRAAAATVTLVPPANPSAAMTEALVRIRGELVSEGFAVDVALAPVPAGAQVGTEAAWPLGQEDAVVTMLGADVPDAVEIRVLDPLTRTPVVRRMSFQPTSDVTSKTLAIHTLELIRATFLELDLSPVPRVRADATPQPAPAALRDTAASPRERERVSVDVGATAVFELDAGLPVLAPLVRVSWALRPWLLPHVTAAGLGTQRKVSSNGATAQVSQQFALVGVGYRMRTDARWRPFLSLSGGVLHTSAQGQADPPTFGRQDQQWSFLLDGAAGCWLRLGDRYQIAFALQAQLAEPYPAVRFADATVKSSTRPSLLLTVTAGSWL